MSEISLVAWVRNSVLTSERNSAPSSGDFFTGSYPLSSAYLRQHPRILALHPSGSLDLFIREPLLQIYLIDRVMRTLVLPFEAERNGRINRRASPEIE